MPVSISITAPDGAIIGDRDLWTNVQTGAVYQNQKGRLVLVQELKVRNSLSRSDSHNNGVFPYGRRKGACP